MTGSMFRAILSLAILAAAFNPRSATAQSCTNQTLERCESNFDCLGAATFDHVCAGRDADDELVPCEPKKDHGAKLCVCYPSAGFRYCESNADCDDLNYCGRSPKTNNTLCLGCKTLGGDGVSDVSFSPVDVADTTARCSIDPPCGRGLDYCSFTMTCFSPYQCTHVVNGSPFSCSQGNTICQCYNVDDGETLSLSECSNNSECTDEREACVWDVASNRNLCASCDAAKMSTYLVLNDTAKCDKLTPRPLPNPVLGPNGKTFDTCLSNTQCLGDRKCMQFRKDPSASDFDPFDLRPCTKKDDSFCFCRPDTLQSCRFASNCEVGESCVTSQRVGASKSCVTNRLLQIIPDSQYTIHGRRKVNEDGDALTWEKCNFDWDCKSPRRCTALGDIFGGCAGRDSCICRALTDSICETDGDCDTGERCAKHVDSHLDPLCVSSKELVNYEYIRPVGELDNATPTPIPLGLASGLTEDPCLSNDDCIGERACRHITEPKNLCNGRRYCQCLHPFGEFKACNNSANCVSGEVCMSSKDAFPLIKSCISRNAYLSSPSLPYRRLYNGPSNTPRTIGPSRTPSPSPTKTPSVTPSPTLSAIPSLPPTPSLEFLDPTASIKPTPPIEDDIGDAAQTDEEGQVPLVSSTGSVLSPDVSDNEIDDTPEPTDDPICIDAKLLSNLHPSSLVFPAHRRAAVLCDVEGTCATPGHMVVYRNVAMSMKSYCSRQGVACSKRVTLVNSPRMRVGLRIESHTPGLQMTALAARYESWVEELALKHVIHIEAFVHLNLYSYPQHSTSSVRKLQVRMLEGFR